MTMPALNVTKEQIENIILDTGVVYVNYGEVGERILAPTRGGNTFEVDREVRIIERDGAMGKEKGLRRVIREDAMLTVRLMDLSMDNLKLALPGTTLNGSKITSTVDGEILEAEYLKNITWIGTDMEGKNKVITLFNPLIDEGIEINAEDKEEAVLEVAFAGHRNPNNKTEPLYTIEEVQDLAPNLTGLTITTATLAPAFASTTYTYGSSVTNAVASVTVTPTSATADEITVNGIVVASGTASGAISLATGLNTITIIVKKSGKVNNKYTVTINKSV
jgi:hypothetical protein